MRTLRVITLTTVYLFCFLITAYAYPDGTLLRNPAGTIFVIIGGNRYGFQSLEAMNASGFANGPVSNVSDAQIQAIPDGGIFRQYPNGTLLRNPAGTIFVVLNGQLFGFGSQGAMFASGYGSGVVHNLKDSEILAVHNGGRFANYPNGTLLRNPAGTIFVILQGKRYGIRNLVYLKLSPYVNNQVFNVTDADVQVIPDGGLYRFPDGTLVRNSAGTIFAFENDQIRGFPSLDSFKASPYRNNTVHQLSNADIAYLSVGPPFPDVPHNPIPPPPPPNQHAGAPAGGPPCPSYAPNQCVGRYGHLCFSPLQQSCTEGLVCGLIDKPCVGSNGAHCYDAVHGQFCSDGLVCNGNEHVCPGPSTHCKQNGYSCP